MDSATASAPVLPQMTSKFSSQPTKRVPGRQVSLPRTLEHFLLVQKKVLRVGVTDSQAFCRPLFCKPLGVAYHYLQTDSSR